MHDLLCGSRIKYRVELWIPDEAWKKSDRGHGSLCKKLLGLTKIFNEYYGGNWNGKS
jgi:hypothetical protein